MGGSFERTSQQQQEKEQKGGSVLGAIGETIVEIAQTSTNIVAGPPGHKPVEASDGNSTARAYEGEEGQRGRNA